MLLIWGTLSFEMSLVHQSVHAISIWEPTQYPGNEVVLFYGISKVATVSISHLLSKFRSISLRFDHDHRKLCSF